MFSSRITSILSIIVRYIRCSSQLYKSVRRSIMFLDLQIVPCMFTRASVLTLNLSPHLILLLVLALYLSPSALLSVLP